jgi:hypothetical protein
MKLATLLSAMMLALSPMACAQTVTGSVTGTVADAADSVIAGARVQLINSISRQAREFTTSSTGAFEFSSILPGNYSLKVTHPGFKSFEQQNVTISSQERVDLHTIKLTVGDVTTSIEVAAEAAHVATNSSDRAQNVNQAQIGDTPIRGRDFMGVLKALPGVQGCDDCRRSTRERDLVNER